MGQPCTLVAALCTSIAVSETDVVKGKWIAGPSAFPCRAGFYTQAKKESVTETGHALFK